MVRLRFFTGTATRNQIREPHGRQRRSFSVFCNERVRSANPTIVQWVRLAVQNDVWNVSIWMKSKSATQNSVVRKKLRLVQLYWFIWNILSQFVIASSPAGERPFSTDHQVQPSQRFERLNLLPNIVFTKSSIKETMMFAVKVRIAHDEKNQNREEA